MCHVCGERPARLWVYKNGDGSTPKYSQDDLVISYGAYNSLSNLCTKCSNRDCQRDFVEKNITHSLQLQRTNLDNSTCLDLVNLKLFRTNPKMLRFVGRGCLLILFVFFSCLGLLYGASTKKTKDIIDNQVELGGPTSFHAGSHMTHRVSLDEFRALSRKAKNYRDIYRIFFKNKQATDEEVDKFLTMKSFEGGLKKQERDYYDDTNDIDADIEKVADEAYLHYLSVKEHPLGSCSKPTPELQHIPPDGNKIYFPEYTILHRCRNVSGCCWNSAQECAEKEIEIVALSFLIAEIDHTRYGKEVYIPEDNKVEIKFFKNVTKCECKDLKMLPRCDKECPFPFVKKRHHTECVCDCLDHNSLKCLEIKYGLEQLPDKDLRCIKEGRCMKPKCDTGELVMKKGYCPGAPNAKLRLYQRSKRDLRKRRWRQIISQTNQMQRKNR